MKNRLPNRIDPVRQTAAYELVVDQIRRVIYLGRYLPGDKLPPERELTKQLGVSRTTVREAIRVLEGEKLVKVKRGATGGIIIASPSELSDVERRLVLSAQSRELKDVFEYRLAIECFAVRCAAKRRTQKDIKELRRLMISMENIAVQIGKGESSIAEYTAMDTRFHTSIASASKNARLVRSVEEIRAAMFLPVGSIFENLTEKVDFHHRPIVEAITDQDPDEAERQMRDHIEHALNGLMAFHRKRPPTRKSI
jgi:GntR family transcriptional repressor for pyruvate dehydrogenase complex